MKLNAGFKVPVMTLLIMLFLTTGLSGQNKKETFDSQLIHFELRGGILQGFGPSESQAEISGGFDTLYYDKKKHLIPGFAQLYSIELVSGFQRNNIRWQGSLLYFEQDLGLIQRFSANEYPFALARMLSAKASVMLQLSNPEKRGYNGFYAGLSIGIVTPLSVELNAQIKELFNVNDLKPSLEAFWSIDFNYIIPLGKKGLYLSAGSSVTMPGLVGSVGKIEMQTNSDYKITRNKVKMYFFSGGLGLGFRL